MRIKKTKSRGKQFSKAKQIVIKHKRLTGIKKTRCSRAGRALTKKRTSAAGRTLANCRWKKY